MDKEFPNPAIAKFYVSFNFSRVKNDLSNLFDFFSKVSHETTEIENAGKEFGKKVRRIRRTKR